MIKKKSIFLIYVCMGLSILISPIITFAQLHFTIRGSIDRKITNQKVFLTYVENGENCVDSAAVKKGKFVLTGTVNNMTKATLLLRPEKEPTKKAALENLFNADEQAFFLTNSKISLRGDNIKTAQITGGKTQNEYLIYKQAVEPLQDSIRSIRKHAYVMRKADKNADISTMLQAIEELDSKLTQRKTGFMQQHLDSYVTLDLLAQQRKNMDLPTFESFFNSLAQNLHSTPLGIEMQRNIDATKANEIGKQAIDFELKDPLGQRIALSDYRGKYLLLDFWASWCVPCRAENPHLKRAYSKYASHQFEILSVSLDTNKELWEKAIAEDQLPWRQVSDLKGGKSTIAAQYGIHAIPQNFLIDPTGKIIAKNLRGDDLEKKIGSFLEK